MIEGFLQSSPGRFSSARLMFVIGMGWSMLMTTMGLVSLGWKVGEACAFFGATTGVFVALKLGQKPMETKQKEKEEVMV
jgi:hypothetical protein